MKNKNSLLYLEMSGRVSELQKLGRDKLAAMKASESHEVSRDGVPFSVTTWVDKLPDRHIRVVVQCYERQGGVMGKVCAEGFRVNEVGKVVSLKENEIYEFL